VLITGDFFGTHWEDTGRVLKARIKADWQNIEKTVFRIIF
jgi:hypothetical protein